MEFKQIKELMAAMGRYGTKRLEYRKEGFELVLERECREVVSQPLPMYSAPVPFLGGGHPPAERLESAFSHGGDISSAALSASEEKKKKEEGGIYVESPMVGTFYSASSPEAPALVKVGDRVEKETVVAIIEAMKVMNEVKAGVSGVVAEICLSNGEPVEVGTPLFRVVESFEPIR